MVAFECSTATIVAHEFGVDQMIFAALMSLGIVLCAIFDLKSATVALLLRVL